MALYTIGKPAILRALDKIEDRLAFEGNKYIPYPKDKGFPDWVLATDGMDNVFWKKDETGGGGGGGGGGDSDPQLLVITFTKTSELNNIILGTIDKSAGDITDALQKKLPLFLKSEYGMFTNFKCEQNNVNDLIFFGTTYTADTANILTMVNYYVTFEVVGFSVEAKMVTKTQIFDD